MTVTDGRRPFPAALLVVVLANLLLWALLIMAAVTAWRWLT